MRITVQSSAYNSISNIESAQSNLAKLQQQLSSGNQITTPSDDPTGTVTALRTRGELSRAAQYTNNSSDAVAWLSTADTAYSQSISTLQDARSVVLQALNSGTADPTSNAALASKLDGLRNQLLQQANANYNGRPVFGGTTANGSAFAADGSYVGDTGQVTRLVGANNSVTVSAVGTDVFGSGSTNVFTMLQNMSTAIAAGNTAGLSTSLSDIDTSLSRLSSAQSVEGAAYSQVQLAQTAGTTKTTALKTELSGIEDADLADLAVQVTTANTTYQAALQTTASIGQLSLLDFLK